MASKAHQSIIARANELGYFPTEADAKKISALSAEAYGNRIVSGEVKPGRIDEKVYAELLDWSIGCVMENRSRFIRTITGLADEKLFEMVKDAAEMVQGKQVRITFEEL